MRTPLRPLLPLGVLAAVAVLLLVPRHVDVALTDLSRTLLGPAGAPGAPLWWALEDLANALLFVPVGMVLAQCATPVPALLLGAGLSAVCEAVQTMIPNRHPDPADLVSNVCGAAAGIVLARLLARRGRRSRQAALAAGGARPVHAAGGGLGGLHPVQAGGAGGGVQPALVERTGHREQRGAIEVGVVAALHPPMVRRGTDVVREPAPAGA